MSRAIVVVCILWSSTALGQPSSDQAESLFHKGRALLAAGKTAEACAAFADSQQIEPAVTTLLNLAGCREKLGQLATAWRLFGEAERQTRTATDDTNRQLHDIARARAQKLEPRLSKLTIRVPPQSRLTGLEITLDTGILDEPLWNQPLPIDGGTHIVTAYASGMERWSTRVTIGTEGDGKVVAIPALRAPSRQREVATANSISSAPTVASPPSERTVLTLLPLVVGGGAAVLLGTGLGFELSADSRYDAAKAEQTDQARRTSLENTANTRRHVAQGLAAAGLGAGGVAVWLYLRSRAPEPEPAASTAIQIVPNGAGLTVTGRF